MGRAKTPSFVTELALRLDPSQERRLLARLEAARQVYNACLGESLKRLRLLRQSKAYRAARKMPRGPKGSKIAKARTKKFRQTKATVGFREYDLHAYAAQFNHCWLGEHLDIHVIQKLATRAFQAVQQYAFGKRGRPRFKGSNQMDTVEGKWNESGIRWREDRVEWLGLTLHAIIDPKDRVIAHGLSCRIKYVRLVRRKLNGRNRFYAQLVCEGRPYQKVWHRPGKGVVGLDIGPSTIAVVGEREAFLSQFCKELQMPWRKIRQLQRKLDRQRRANNPQNYNPDGTIRRGPKVWRKSGRQRHTEAQLSELWRKLAAYRKSLHGRLVNRVLRVGDTYQMEKLSYRAFQRRFGRSVAMRAPGMFVERLRRKAERADAEVNEFPTLTTRLSQVCHNCRAAKRKSLSQRWHMCECGIVAQRDLYSAFLASCVEGDRLNADRARERWSGVDTLLQAALSQVCESSQTHQPANGRPGSRRCLPSSFGIARRSLSGSPVETGVNAAEAQDVVSPLPSSSEGESLGEAAGSPEPPAFRRGGVSGQRGGRLHIREEDTHEQ
jgi:putative transposase